MCYCVQGSIHMCVVVSWMVQRAEFFSVATPFLSLVRSIWLLFFVNLDGIIAILTGRHVLDCSVGPIMKKKHIEPYV